MRNPCGLGFGVAVLGQTQAERQRRKREGRGIMYDMLKNFRFIQEGLEAHWKPPISSVECGLEGYEIAINE